MRNTVINTIYSAAREDKNIMFLTADLGYSVVENFQQELPGQIINVGISEQNMIGVAAGLALSGKKVFAYSIVPFVTMRCFEQIRIDVCYQNLDVAIIGVGGGFAYGSAGPTHFGLEDLTLMRSLPNMKIVAPADPYEALSLSKQVITTKGPWYIRLNRGGEKNITENSSSPIVGFGSIVKQGSDATIFSIGAITDVAVDAARVLDLEGISTEVIHLHTLKPIDSQIIISRIHSRKVIITIEEHTMFGALGSAVSEVIACERTAIPFKMLGVGGQYPPLTGKQDFLRSQAGLSSEHVANTIRNLWKI